MRSNACRASLVAVGSEATPRAVGSSTIEFFIFRISKVWRRSDQYNSGGDKSSGGFTFLPHLGLKGVDENCQGKIIKFLGIMRSCVSRFAYSVGCRLLDAYLHR